MILAEFDFIDIGQAVFTEFCLYWPSLACMGQGGLYWPSLSKKAQFMSGMMGTALKFAIYVLYILLNN